MITDSRTPRSSGTPHSSGRPYSNGAPAGTVVRLAAAALVFVGGLVHVRLYFDGYRNLPDANLGRSFVANGLASTVIAIALVARREAIIRLAGIGLAAGTLGAFALSRTNRGVFGLIEKGLHPAPQALIALVVEVGAVLLLALTFVPAIGAGRSLPTTTTIAASVATLAVALAASVTWVHGATTAPLAAGTASSAGATVVIEGFAFTPSELTVPLGTTITWRNADGFKHTVSSADGSFVSTSLAPGDTFQHTFNAAGTFTYICGIHPSMAAEVVVG
jgi:plastocyanin